MKGAKREESLERKGGGRKKKFRRKKKSASCKEITDLIKASRSRRTSSEKKRALHE